MRNRLLALVLLASIQTANSGERCIAIDGDTLVCNQRKVRLTNVYAAELNQAGGGASTGGTAAIREILARLPLAGLAERIMLRVREPVASDR